MEKLSRLSTLTLCSSCTGLVSRTLTLSRRAGTCLQASTDTRPLRDNLVQSLKAATCAVRAIDKSPVSVAKFASLRHVSCRHLSLGAGKSLKSLGQQNVEGSDVRLPSNNSARLYRTGPTQCLRWPGTELSWCVRWPSAGPSWCVRWPSSHSARLYSTDTSQPQESSHKKKSDRDSKKSPISWKTLLVVAAVGCVLVLVVELLKQKKQLERSKARNRFLGKAQLGGDWTLTDHHGNKRSSIEFRGQWLLIYFGFTHCPDVCPEEVEKIVEVIGKTDADKNLPNIQPLIITVDPERDTPQAMKEYCAEFSPRLLGFTGSMEEIHQATRAYRVYYSPGPKDEDSDYIVDHSIISYLVNPRGEFVDYFGQNKTVTEIYNTIRMHIHLYLKKENS